MKTTILEGFYCKDEETDMSWFHTEEPRREGKEWVSEGPVYLLDELEEFLPVIDDPENEPIHLKITIQY